MFARYQNSIVSVKDQNIKYRSRFWTSIKSFCLHWGKNPTLNNWLYSYVYMKLSASMRTWWFSLFSNVFAWRLHQLYYSCIVTEGKCPNNVNGNMIQSNSSKLIGLHHIPYLRRLKWDWVNLHDHCIVLHLLCHCTAINVSFSVCAILHCLFSCHPFAYFIAICWV